MTLSGMRNMLNDALSIYFLDATLAGPFVARWCAGCGVETFQRSKRPFLVGPHQPAIARGHRR